MKHPNFDLMHCTYLFRFVFDEFIVKEEENVHKVEW
jgi:hypothetical protein